MFVIHSNSNDVISVHDTFDSIIIDPLPSDSIVWYNVHYMCLLLTFLGTRSCYKHVDHVCIRHSIPDLHLIVIPLKHLIPEVHILLLRTNM